MKRAVFCWSGAKDSPIALQRVHQAAGHGITGLLIPIRPLTDLPSEIDPCGKNGEFHSLVYQEPVFNKNIGVKTSETVNRDGLCFCGLLPATDGALN